MKGQLDNNRANGIFDSPAYDDLRVPMTSTKLGGTKDPDFTVFKTNGAGSQGVFIYWFDPNAEEELYFAVQLPHGWQGSNLYPHVHWTPEVTSDGNPADQKVKWGLEYTFTEIGGDFSNTQFAYGNVHLPQDADVVAGRHYVTPLTQIVPSATQKGMSSMLVCRLFRNATDASDDTYEHDAGMMEFDFHIIMDAAGSKAEFTK